MVDVSMTSENLKEIKSIETMLFFFLLGEVGSTAGLQEALIHTHT